MLAAIIDFSLPLKNPVLIFSLVLFIILFAPILLNKFKIPHIIGLIIAGVLIGPHGFNFLLRDSSIVLFGTVGLLYIMFLAGLEMDVAGFKKNKEKSIVFGLFTFLIPMILGTVVSHLVLQYSLMTSVLLASMFASHTLVAYPIASRLGISKTRAVTITIGGTMITDILALLVLAVIAGMAHGNIGQGFWLRLGISVTIFAAVVLIGFPFLARWFFKRYDDQISQYIFVLGMVFLAAFLAEMAGVEAIIGAFLAGLALNKFIPHTSALMNRVEFVGNALFIPFFLIGVGMLVDLRVMLKGPMALIVAVTMTSIALLAKFLAAYATQRTFKLTDDERKIIFGLSSAQAAATLAAVMVGYNIILGEAETGEPIRLLNEDVLNGTILMILVTCTVASMAVERAARKIAVTEEEAAISTKDIPRDKILISIANPDSLEESINLASLIKDPKNKEPLYALHVIDDHEDRATNRRKKADKVMEQAAKYAAGSDQRFETIIRYDLKISSGIAHTVKEKDISEVIVGWHNKSGLIDSFLGIKSDALLRAIDKMIFVYKSVQPLNTIQKIIVAMPEKAEYESGFEKLFDRIHNLALQTGSKVTFYGSRSSLDAALKLNTEYKNPMDMKVQEFDDWEDFLVLAREVKSDDLFVIVSARKATLSYVAAFDKLPYQLSKYFKENNILIVYPEQYVPEGANNLEFLDVPLAAPITENLNRAGDFVKKLFKGES
ncbi:MAG: cation:proton antiporter [Cyclobacteriaceae bacterium]|nr:cation:proton antiporter [Cyclobacteriaceae bacterium]UYN87894.1 MAG: cation:proton antiporter [Cyclobacteriaceae bacterium]